MGKNDEERNRKEKNVAVKCPPQKIFQLHLDCLYLFYSNDFSFPFSHTTSHQSTILKHL